MAKFKSLKIGDTVRVVSLADTGARCGDACLNKYIGGTFKVTSLQRQPSTGLGQVQLSNGWWFSPKGLEVLTPDGAVRDTRTGDEHGEFVTPETPVGTRVLYIGGAEDLTIEIGTEFILKRHALRDEPRVHYTDKVGWEYINYKYLRVQPVQSVQSVQEAPSTPEVEQELTTDDFKYTRVRAKDTGAEGVVVGRSQFSNAVAVLHDEVSSYYHDGNGSNAVDFVGVESRIWYYQAWELEIIGGVQ